MVGDDGIAIKRVGSDKYKVVTGHFQNLTDIDFLSGDATLCWLMYQLSANATITYSFWEGRTVYFLKRHLTQDQTDMILFMLRQEMLKEDK